MSKKPQLAHPVPVALAAAAIAFACGRSELSEPVDPTTDVALSITAGQLGPESFVQVPNLAQFRLDHWQRIRGTLPPLNAVPNVREAPRGQLLRWTRNVLEVRQLEGMPMVYHDPSDGRRYKVFFDHGMIYASQVWEEHDQMWSPIMGEDVVVPSVDRAEPIMLWSDMYGALEMRDCRPNAEERFDCDVSHEAQVNAYFPRGLVKGSGPSNLACLSNCLDPNGSNDAPYFEMAHDPEIAPSDAAMRYEYDVDAQVLSFEGQDVAFDGGQELRAVSGFMIEDHDKYLVSMACSFDEEQPIGVCDYQEHDEFYTWSTDSALTVFGRRPVR